MGRWARQVIRGGARLIAGPGLDPTAAPPQNLLFLQHETALGAAVNATPLFEAIKEASPRTRVTVAASGAAAQVLRHNPRIDRFVETASPHQEFGRAAGAIALLRRKSGPFDYCATDSGNMKSRIGLLAVLSGAKCRAGFTVVPELFHLPLDRDPSLSVRDDNLRLIRTLGFPDSRPEPRIYFTAAESAAAELLLRDVPAPVVLFITQTSGGQPTEWFEDRFAQLADHLAASRDAAIVFAGTQAQALEIGRIRARMRRPSLDLSGATDIPVLAALLCQADLVVTLDTGPMHMARAAGVPTVVIAPAWQPAIEWLPLGVAHCRIVRRNDIPCRECRKFYCATHECMDEISVDMVISAIDRHWMDFPPDAERRAHRMRQGLARGEGDLEQ